MKDFNWKEGAVFVGIVFVGSLIAMVAFEYTKKYFLPKSQVVIPTTTTPTA